MNLLTDSDVHVLGVYAVPDQTAPALVRDKTAPENEEVVGEIVDRLRTAGATTTSKLVYTHNRRDAIDRIAKDEASDVILVPNLAERMEWILVPLRGDVNVERITGVVGGFSDDTLRHVQLLHVTGSESESDQPTGEALLATAREQLRDSGIDEQVIDAELVESDDAVGTITERAKNYDAIVMGGTKPSLMDHIFGDIPHRISQASGCAVFVVPPKS
jgi:nucleotide-binding universal stress UspA family protein